MNKLKHYTNKTKSYFNKKPKLLIPLFAGLFFLILAGVEYNRAINYLDAAENYKNSVKVLSVKDSVERLVYNTENSNQAYYCELDFNNLISESNPAYKDEAEYEVAQLVEELKLSTENAQEPPSYNSLMQFIPKVKSARDVSTQLHSSLDSLEALASDDSRTSYCLELEKVLAEVYFLDDIRKPEAVGALYVGQIEKFQINVSNAQSGLLAMKYPEGFEQLHADLYKILETIKTDMQSDTNNYEEFSRLINANIVRFEDVLVEIGNQAADLQSKSIEISLQADLLN